MLPAEFLRAVWPIGGFYVLATPWLRPDGTHTFVNKTFPDIAGAVRFAEQKLHHHDLFFSVHTMAAAQTWNPLKTNWRTGELGAYETRSQSNALHARAFFLDLDVEPGNARKYASQADAIRAIQAFCAATGLPKPMLTSSGGGVHVYWLLDDAVPSGDWKVTADKLKQLTRFHGLRADPARTADSASLLRVAGSFNFKDRTAPRPVLVYREATPVSTSGFLAHIHDAVIRAGITLTTPPKFQPETDLGSNLTDEWQGPPVPIRAVLTACAQMRQLALMGGNVSEPEWYHSLNLVRFVENGAKLVHKFSEKHPAYDPGQTDSKVAQLEAKGVKPTTCFKLAEVCGEDACTGCRYAGRVKNPLMAARFKDEAPAPVVAQVVGTTVTTTEVPPPPKPYTRLKAGGIAVTAKTKDGDEQDIVIFPCDLYPVRRLVNTALAVEQQMWRVMLPREGEKDFLLDADALYDRKKFVSVISNQGIYPQPGNVPYLQEYMIAYIAELQKQADAETQCNHLGWTEDQTGFILPDRILEADGTARPAMLSIGAERASATVHKQGTLQRQVELMRFYDHPAYVPNQFYILCSLAAPIFLFSGHHGVVCNASGSAGSSKSSSLYAGASFWGTPQLYPINGTNNGATTRGRAERVTTLANLPICVDEITNMPPRDAVDLAMSITQPGHRIRLNTDGVERSALGGHKATVMLTSANSSLHNVLSNDNASGTAGSMRVFEIMFRPQMVHTKAEADDFLHALRDNYGHIGELFVAYVVQNRDAVAKRVRDLVRSVDKEADIQSSERFWSALIATVLCAAEITKELGVLTYDPEAIKTWVLTKQVPFMRGVVVEEYSTPIGLLADYLETIHANILVTRRGPQMVDVLREPRGEMLGHYDKGAGVLWLLKAGFKTFCTRSGANSSKVLDELTVAKLDVEARQTRIVTNKHIRRTLGAFTDYAKAQSWCIQIDMTHPEITGTFEANEEPEPPKKAGRTQLRLVG